MSNRPGTITDLHAYLELLAGPAPARKLFELRHRAGVGGMRQRFIPARRLDLAASTIIRLGEQTDVYIGVLLRTRRAGGRDAVNQSHLAFCEIDRPDADQRLDRFRCPPTVRVSSGTDGHRHAYWLLERPVDADQLVVANRRLAYAVGGDPASTDPARVLRPPATVNRKHTPPTLVTLLDLDPARRYPLADLIDELADPPARPRLPAAPISASAVRGGDALLAVPTVEYVARLTGLRPNREGKVRCPFHDPDRTPSLHLYPDGSWYCYGACQTGGSIYDFASRLWSTGRSPGVKLRGRQFVEVRDRLAAIFLADSWAGESAGRVIDRAQAPVGRPGGARPSAGC